MNLSHSIRANQNELQHLLFDQIFDAIVVVDRDGKIVLINQALCRLLGGTEKDFLGRHMLDAVSPEATLHLVAQGLLPQAVGGRIRVRGQEFVTKLIPIRVAGEIVGAAGIALFSDAQQALTCARALNPAEVKGADRPRVWHSSYTIQDIIGTDPAVERVRMQIRKAATYHASVLISGETGTGKELVAHAIHALSSRANEAFVRINCSNVPAELVESELFGYEGGAFTGSRSGGSPGKFELADRGTIFLDEIGDMPLNAQSALLRVLQEREIVRVGGRGPIPVDVRVICATNRKLSDLVQAGSFRQDLFYRLDVLQIKQPAVRERNDFDLLLNHLIERVRLNLRLPPITLPQQTLQSMKCQSWPGNVREMRNAVERLLLSDGIALSEAVSSPSSAQMDFSNRGGQPAAHAGDLKQMTSAVERETILRALRSTNGNVTQAARHLGVNRANLYKKLKRHNIGDLAEWRFRSRLSGDGACE